MCIPAPDAARQSEQPHGAQVSGESRYTDCPIHGNIHRIDMQCVQCRLAGPQQREVDIDGTPHLVCAEHGRIYQIGQTCSLCAAHARDTLNVLEARIADQDSQIADLRRNVNELRHIVLDVQRALNLFAAHVRPNPDLLP